MSPTDFTPRSGLPNAVFNELHNALTDAADEPEIMRMLNIALEKYSSATVRKRLFIQNEGNTAQSPVLP